MSLNKKKKKDWSINLGVEAGVALLTPSEHLGEFVPSDPRTLGSLSLYAWFLKGECFFQITKISYD